MNKTSTNIVNSRTYSVTNLFRVQQGQFSFCLRQSTFCYSFCYFNTYLLHTFNKFCYKIRLFIITGFVSIMLYSVDWVQNAIERNTYSDDLDLNC